MTTQTTGKYIIILNPVAGNGKALGALPKIERFFTERDLPHEIILTKGANDAIEVAKNLDVDDETVVVAAGGDGTCNEVVNGLLTHSTPLKTPPLIALLPIGRGNDFAYSAALPNDLDAALEILLRRKVIPLDVGFVKGGFFPDGRFFVNGLGIGFDTKVGFEAAKMKHLHSGISYVYGALITLLKFEAAPKLTVAYNGTEVTKNLLIVSLMNGRRMGGVFFMGPHAELNDGLLDICTVEQTKNRRRLLQIIKKYTSGTQEESPEVALDKAASYHLTAIQGGMAAHCDGETVCYAGTDLEVTCYPASLRLITGA